MKNKKKRLRWIVPVVILVLLIAGCYGGYMYVNDYYHASDRAEAALVSDGQVTVSTLEDDTIVFAPEEICAGIIFYPGGKVEYTAYAPLMRALAENGFLCILPHMPCNLAVLDVNAADGYEELFPEIEIWYLGGHSLGGAMAASYAGKHASEYEGLILLAAYSTVDLTDSGLTVLSVYGEYDQVLNMEKYEKYKSNLPDDYTEMVIEGGCHSYFGSYGLQEGDGTPTITEEEQISTTADYINWINLQFSILESQNRLTGSPLI